MLRRLANDDWPYDHPAMMMVMVMMVMVIIPMMMMVVMVVVVMILHIKHLGLGVNGGPRVGPGFREGLLHRDGIRDGLQQVGIAVDLHHIGRDRRDLRCRMGRARDRQRPHCSQ